MWGAAVIKCNELSPLFLLIYSSRPRLPAMCYYLGSPEGSKRVFFFFIFFFIFCPHHLACGISVPHPGVEPVPPAGKVQHLNHWTTREVPICCCSVAKSCWTLCDLVNRSTQGFPVLYYLLEFAPTQVHRVSDAIQPCQPQSLPSPPALSLSWLQGLFQ